MFSVFLNLVKKVGIFVIIGQTIMHFGISSKYEKYMKLVISFMVAAQIIFAFGVYLKVNDNSRQVVSLDEYIKEWNISMKEVEERMEKSKEEMAIKMEKEMTKAKSEVVEQENVKNYSIRIEKIVIP